MLHGHYPPAARFHLAERLRRNGIECEYADRDYLVLMAAPENREEDFFKTAKILDKNCVPAAPERCCPVSPAGVRSVRRRGSEVSVFHPPTDKVSRRRFSFFTVSDKRKE